MESIIIFEHTQYSPVEISVDFIKNRPTSILELVLKGDTGDKRYPVKLYKSNRFNEGDLVHWQIKAGLGMFAHFAVSPLP